MEINDWRLFGQEQYLMNKILKKKTFDAKCVGVDHVHCDFCWAKFGGNSEDLHEGYVTLDGRYWICSECCDDFKSRFNWIVQN